MAKKNQKSQRSTTSSNWEQSIRTVSDLSSRAASPMTPPMPDGWNDEELYKGKEEKGEFTAGELGLPDDDEAQSRDGRGPLQQEGEGNRQNDQLAELEQDIDAKADLERRR